MPALCSMLFNSHRTQNYARITGTCLQLPVVDNLESKVMQSQRISQPANYIIQVNTFLCVCIPHISYSYMCCVDGLQQHVFALSNLLTYKVNKQIGERNYELQTSPVVHQLYCIIFTLWQVSYTYTTIQTFDLQLYMMCTCESAYVYYVCFIQYVQAIGCYTVQLCAVVLSLV